jgi:hypothetical protein
MGSGRAFEIKDGKRVAVLGGAGVLFRAPELWKSLFFLGGKESAKRFGISSWKGEPPQTLFHSVTAVPTLMKDATIIDILRKA